MQIYTFLRDFMHQRASRSFKNWKKLYILEYCQKLVQFAQTPSKMKPERKKSAKSFKNIQKKG